MDPLNFAYWLNGFAELTGDTPPTPEQWRSIREHLATVTPPGRVSPAIGPTYTGSPTTGPNAVPPFGVQYTVECSSWHNRSDAQWAAKLMADGRAQRAAR